jgi:hypothetical protein
MKERTSCMMKNMMWPPDHIDIYCAGFILKTLQSTNSAVILEFGIF